MVIYHVIAIPWNNFNKNYILKTLNYELKNTDIIFFFSFCNYITKYIKEIFQF